MHDALFGRLEHTWTRHARLDPRFLDTLHRRAQAVQIEIVERDAGGARGDGGFKLFRRPHQQVQLRRDRRRGQTLRRGVDRRYRPDCDRPRLGLQLRERLHRISPQSIQYRHGRKRRALHGEFDLAQHVRRAAETAKLLHQLVPCKPAPLGLFQRRRSHGDRARTVTQRPRSFERAAGSRPHAYVHHLPPHGQHIHRSIQIRVARTPQQISRPDAGEIHRSVAEAQLQLPTRRALHLKHPAALFRLLRAPPIGAIEHHAVTRFERRQTMHGGGGDQNGIGHHARHAAHQQSPMAGRPASHHRLMIGAGNKECTEPAGKNLLEPQLFNRRYRKRSPRPGIIHRLAISLRRERHVAGILIASFDLERGNPNAHQFRHLMQREKIPGRQQIPRVSERP